MQSTTQLFSLIRSKSIQLNKAVSVRILSTNPAEVSEEFQESAKPWTEIPGPSSLPIIGQLHHFLPIFGSKLSDQKYFLETIWKAFGPIVRLDPLLGRKAHIFLFDPEDSAKVLRGENWMPIRPGFDSLIYYRREKNKANGKPNKSIGLLTDQGENWKSFRSTVNPVMMQPKAMKLYAPVIEKVAQDMVARMKTNRDESNKLIGQFDTEMNLWSLESIAVVALGCRLDCLTRTLDENSPEKRLIQCVYDLFQVNNELDSKPSLWRTIPTKKFKEAMKLFEEQEDLAKYFIEKSFKENETKTNDDEKSILEKLYEIDQEIAVTMACDMLFAGVDTAATAITSTFYLLAKYPEKQEKLREALKISDTKYLKACIKESMRVLPVTSANIRELTKDTVIKGYKLPKGTNVVVCFKHLGHSESQYPQPLEFIPERWIDKDSPLSYTNAHPFSYSPFGFGVRMCAGRRIAELELEIFLSEVVKNFHIDWLTRPIPDLNIQPAFLNHIKGPFDFVFKDL